LNESQSDEPWAAVLLGWASQKDEVGVELGASQKEVVGLELGWASQNEDVVEDVGCASQNDDVVEDVGWASQKDEVAAEDDDPDEGPLPPELLVAARILSSIVKSGFLFMRPSFL